MNSNSLREGRHRITWPRAHFSFCAPAQCFSCLAERGLEFGHFVPVSRSETTMVAVGLSPRTESKHTIQRRVATAELTTGTEVFNRRDATRDNVVWSLRPWTEVHGYLHGLAPRGPAGSLSGFGGAE